MKDVFNIKHRKERKEKEHNFAKEAVELGVGALALGIGLSALRSVK